MNQKENKRRRAPNPYDFLPPVHDHFEGAAHCVECGGPCQLNGADLAYTVLVRYLFEGEAYGFAIPPVAARHMEEIGINVARMRKRARGMQQALK